MFGCLWRRAAAPWANVRQEASRAPDGAKMTTERQLEVPPAPASIERDGRPRFGTYSGEVPEIALSRLGQPYCLSAPQRLVRHKTWQYTVVATPEVLAMFSVADLTYTA